jgi:PAS domain-containing protein
MELCTYGIFIVGFVINFLIIYFVRRELLAILHDHIEKNKDKLIYKQSKYRLVFNNISQPIFLVDKPSGIITEANDFAYEKLGYQAKEINDVLCFTDIIDNQFKIEDQDFSEGATWSIKNISIFRKDGTSITSNIYCICNGTYIIYKVEFAMP